MDKIEVHKIDKGIVVDILCDCCGNTCFQGMNFEYLSLSTCWGYDSSKDLERWEAKVCEECVDTKFSFIKFYKTNYGSSMGFRGSDITKEEAEERNQGLAIRDKYQEVNNG